MSVFLAKTDRLGCQHPFSWSQHLNGSPDALFVECVKKALGHLGPMGLLQNPPVLKMLKVHKRDAMQTWRRAFGAGDSAGGLAPGGLAPLG